MHCGLLEGVLSYFSLFHSNLRVLLFSCLSLPCYICLSQHTMNYKFVSSMNCRQFEANLHALLMFVVYFPCSVAISLHCGSPEGEFSELSTF